MDEFPGIVTGVYSGEQPNLKWVCNHMKPTQADTEKDPAKQAKKFEQQPAKTKELELLKDQAEKSTGAERVESNKKIRDEANQPDNGERRQ